MVKYTVTYSKSPDKKAPRTSHVECKYYEITRCGDGIVDTDRGEICDPKDPNKTGWGNGGCDASCKPINTIIPKADCDATFYGKLRHGRGYVFDDQITGTPTKSRYLKDFKVDHREQLDFNGADPFPSFEWTKEIKNQNMILNPNQTIKILTATSPYYVREKPIKRDKNNLYLEYTIWYSDSQNGAWSAEKECKYYEITRCGDGILDPEYGETCDPNDPSKTGWGKGGCDENCKPKDIPQIPGQCNSQYNGQTVENLTGGNHLCTTGTMTQFQFNSATNRWTWKCDGMN